MIWKRHPPQGGKSAETPQYACLDRRPAEIVAVGEVWTQLRLPDGTTPYRLTARTLLCVCQEKGCVAP
ncbi:hypothetical protein GCM10017673_37940 [Streptosporangium violaceochromogenes]|nr:hypothetical protein GCM10017673_37940 [Streptosporangium violaceochromogenes]